MISPQLLDLRVAHPLEELDRLRKLAGSIVSHRQVVERVEGVGVVGSQFLRLGIAYLLY